MLIFGIIAINLLSILTTEIKNVAINVTLQLSEQLRKYICSRLSTSKRIGIISAQKSEEIMWTKNNEIIELINIYPGDLTLC